MPTDQATRTHIDRTELRALYHCKRDRLTIRRTFTRVVSYAFPLDTSGQVTGWPTRTIVYLEGDTVAGRYYVPGQQCPTCRAFMTAKLINGTLSPAKTCSPTCHAATGPTCRCSCAGARHGEMWQLA